ncbi:polysaccharide biosynthesis/export family protein [Sediminitomix flava]|uniref:Polysaccharide export outer membrane protein n=1 Tax=Sediminitomix flava TaxID=379075 RepID=A0A315Z0E2_SEDFL|nr:polysaccharide biosynthesis/export family protein [Sediminitomix flava]PWJ36098.1 polysaccharide export outer membrane protein [Sediminitomix flava]
MCRFYWDNLRSWSLYKSILIFSILFSSCQPKLFTTKSEIKPENFALLERKVSRNYVISINDFIAMSVFTNSGEVLIDPNNEFIKGSSGGRNTNQNNQRNQQNQQNGNGFNSLMNLPIFQNGQEPRTFMVDTDGFVNLPMIGKIEIAGYTIKEAEDLVKKQYTQFYVDPFVTIQYLNKRVLLFGGLGDQVIPLRNENMTLLEVLAFAGGLQQNGQVDNIRLIRPDAENAFKEPSVQIIDLTTIDGLIAADMDIMPGDIIYVEPRRRLDRSYFSDILTFTSLITSFVTLYVLIRDVSTD